MAENSDIDMSDPEEPFVDSGSEYQPSDEEYGSNEIVEPEPQTPQPRKRGIRNTSRRTISKKKRTAGEEHTNTKGTIIAAKTIENFECSCLLKCHLKVSEERQRNLLKVFYSLASFDLQTAHICSLIELSNILRRYKKDEGESRREKTRLYCLTLDNGDKVKVCKAFFKNVFQISDGRITRALKNKATGGTPPVDRRGKHIPANKTSEEKSNEVKEFINRFPSYQSHYSRKKNPERRYLAPDLCLSKMYNIYKQLSESPSSNFVFRQIFHKDFNLHFHAPVSDSCKRCDVFEMKLKSTNDPELLRQINVERELHQRKADSARDGMKLDTEMGKQPHQDVTVIAFDLMKTLPTPVISTGICYYKRQLWTYCLGIHNLSYGEAYMFMWHEAIASRGPQEIGSCIMYFIKNYVRTSRVIMYSDQCGGQNRNIKFSLLCSYIVSSPSFVVEQIDHKFLVSGHSYLACDQDFGLIEKEKKYYKEIYTPEDWSRVVLTARKKIPFNIVNMKSENFFSSKQLESIITNRKIASDKSKVEWLNMQWIRLEKNKPFIISYKYSNNEIVSFNEVDVKKRMYSGCPENLIDLLYPNGRKIDAKKKADLMELLQFIPPINHNFYSKLKTTDDVSDDFIAISSDGEEIPE